MIVAAAPLVDPADHARHPRQRGHRPVAQRRSRSCSSPFDTAARTRLAPGRQRMARHHRLRRPRAVRTRRCGSRSTSQRGAEIEARGGDPRVPGAAAAEPADRASSYPTVDRARCRAASPSNFQYTVEIDKGSNDGIAVGMPVVNGGRPRRQDHPGLPELEHRAADHRPRVQHRRQDPHRGRRAGRDDAADRADDRRARRPRAASTPRRPARPRRRRPRRHRRPHDHPPTLDPTRRPGARHAATTSCRPASPTTATPPRRPRPTPIEVIRETGTLQRAGRRRPLILDFVEQSTTVGHARGRVDGRDRRRRDSASHPPAPDRHRVGGDDPERARSSPIVEVEPSAGDLSQLNFVSVLLYLPNLSGG